MKTICAYCWRNGEIATGASCPDGALPLVTGPRVKVMAALNVVASHDYDGATLRVPMSLAWALDNDMDAALQDVQRCAAVLQHMLA